MTDRPHAALHLDLLPGRFAVARLEADAETPSWAGRDGFVSITRSPGELSVVCAESRVPRAVRAQRGFRCLRVRGPLPFEQVGVLSALAEPLAAVGVSLFCLSTFDTDYLFVSSGDLGKAERALRAAGHGLREVAQQDGVLARAGAEAS